MICLIAAMSENRVIGKDNDIPWKMPVDMKFFRETTDGHPLIVGRKTFESFGSMPLPNRRNIVITRNRDYDANGAEVVRNLDEALELVQKETGEIFIGGGEQVYYAALPYADRIYLTTIHTEVEGDTYFPDFHKGSYIETHKLFVEADERNPYDCTFRRYDLKTFED